MILASFFTAVAQLPDRRFRSVRWRGSGLTIALLIGILLPAMVEVARYWDVNVDFPLKHGERHKKLSFKRHFKKWETPK